MIILARDVKNGYLNFSRGDTFDVLSLHENDWVVRDAAGNFGRELYSSRLF
jgi:hypothetical protein